jgi:hypothetical protein
MKLETASSLQRIGLLRRSLSTMGGGADLRPWCVAVLLLLVAPAAGRAFESLAVPVLDVHTTEVYDYGNPLGWLFFAKDWSLAADGTASAIVRYGTPGGGFGPALLTRSGSPPGWLVQQLRQSLGQVHIRTVVGECSPFGAAPGESFRFEVTWYGRNGARNHFVISTEFQQACPAELQPFLYALQDFEHLFVDPGLPVWKPGSDVHP